MVRLRVVAGFCRQVLAGIIRRCDYLRLNVEEENHPVKIEFFSGSLLHLFATAVEETFEGEHLGAVHVDGLANAHEGLFGRRHREFVVLDGLVHLVGHCFQFSLLSLHTLMHSNLVCFMEH